MIKQTMGGYEFLVDEKLEQYLNVFCFILEKMSKYQHIEIRHIISAFSGYVTEDQVKQMIGKVEKFLN